MLYGAFVVTSLDMLRRLISCRIIVIIIIIIIIITSCYGATQPTLSSALQPYSLYNTV